ASGNPLPAARRDRTARVGGAVRRTQALVAGGGPEDRPRRRTRHGGGASRARALCRRVRGGAGAGPPTAGIAARPLPRLARYPAGPAGRPGVGRLQYSAGRRPACRPQGGPRRVRALGRRDRPPARGSEEGKADGAAGRAQPGTQARRGGPCRGACPFVKTEMTMKKLTQNDPETRSPDGVAENIQRLKTLFPELVTEGP